MRWSPTSNLPIGNSSYLTLLNVLTPQLQALSPKTLCPDNIAKQADEDILMKKPLSWNSVGGMWDQGFVSGRGFREQGLGIEDLPQGPVSQCLGLCLWVRIDLH